MKKLPKLPRMKSPTRNRSSMPGLPKLSEDPEPLPDKVQPKSGNIADTRIGRWFEVDDVTAWGGRCARCGRAVPAIELDRFIPPFGKADDEMWACRECRREATLSKRSGGPKPIKAKPVEQLRESVNVGSYRDQLEGMMGDLLRGNLTRIDGRQEGDGLKCKWPDRTPDKMKAAFTTIGHIGNQLLKLKKEER